MKKSILLCGLAVALVAITALALSAPAGASSLFTKTITVETGASIFIDGVELFPTDAGGHPVETFIYNGTTYVPIRAVSEAFNKPVDWDGINQRVYIGKIPGETQYLSDLCPPYSSSGVEKPDSVVLAGVKYTEAYTFGDDLGTDNYALFNLNGKYNKLEFDVGHVDKGYMSDATLNIFLDGKLAHTQDLSCEDLPQHVTVPLNGALQMKIEIPGATKAYGITISPNNYAIVNATIE